MKKYMAKCLLNDMMADRLTILDSSVLDLLEKIELYTSLIDIKYENKLRDMELINSIHAYNDDIKQLINKINDIERVAIENKCDSLMFSCENRKAALIGLMTTLQNKYL